jgi:hypothetical protein
MKKICCSIVVIFYITSSAYADSPLTYTDFYKGYMDVPEVKKALELKGYLSHDLMKYIANDTNKLDVKLAIINAIGWDHKNENSYTLLHFLYATKKYNSEFRFSEYTSLTYYGSAHDQICYAYDVIGAYDLSVIALKKSPNSFAINMISNLIKSQVLVSIDESCYAYSQFSSIKKKSNIQMDMKKESIPYIFEYMDSMGKGCK